MTTSDWIIIAIFSFIIGLFIGWVVTYSVMIFIKDKTCNHSLEHIGSHDRISGRTKAFLCTKCGKVKKVRF